MSISDALMWRYIELLSFEPPASLTRWKQEIEGGGNPRDIKARFAKEIAARFHGAGAAEAAQAEFEQRFRHGVLPEDMPEITLQSPAGGLQIAQLLKLAQLAASTSEGARAIEQGYKDEVRASISHDDTTGEDLEVRRAALNALGDKAGTVVVMNPKTGQVYTVVNQEFALRHGVKPCSTVKLVTGLAGLTESVINPTQTVNIGTASYHIDLTDSLAFSDNGYFQRVGGQVGFSKMMEYARKLVFVDPQRILLAGQSAGGFASIAASSMNPAGLIGVVNFSGGRGGDPEMSPGEPCRPDTMAAAIGRFARTIKVPTLWIYAENDKFFGPKHVREWFAAFEGAGGKGRLAMEPAFGTDGHALFGSRSGVPIWTAEVDKFLTELGFKKH